mgnify:CR=1 FL=1
MKKLLLTLLCLTMIFISCNSGNNNKNLTIGDFYQGGVIFWLDNTGQHGLVCDITDLGVTEWGCFGTSVAGADGTVIGTGCQNTLDILSQCSLSPHSNLAVNLCVNNTAQGYSDWFLPSKDELNQMYLNMVVINTTAESNEGVPFADLYYWSSSKYEYNLTNAWVQNFNDGWQHDVKKKSHYSVRAIRSF